MNFSEILWWVWGRYLFKKVLRFTERRDYRRALLICEGLMRWFPHSPRVHCQLGFLYDTIGVPDLSVFHSKKAICLLKANNKWFEPYMNLGIGFIHLNVPAAAVSAFNMAESLKDKVGMVEYGKMLLFRAEARRDIMRMYGMKTEMYNNALTDLAQGEHVLKQVPERRRELEAMVKA